MSKLTKRTVESLPLRSKDYIVWDDELPGYGIRIYPSGKRTYVVQYKRAGRSRRYAIGLHGIWTPETARNEAKIQLGRVAKGEDPTELRRLDRNAITFKQLCDLYKADLDAGVILGKGGRPKKPSTAIIDAGRITRHLVPLIGPRRVKDITRADVIKVMRDIIAGRTKAIVKTGLRGKAVVRGGPGTARRTIGLLGGILTYAIDLGIIEHNPAHGIQRPTGTKRTRRLSEAEYRVLGGMLRKAIDEDPANATAVEIIRQLTLTGCRRSEIVKLRWSEIDFEGSCLRLGDTKEGPSVRPIGLSALEGFERLLAAKVGSPVFPGRNSEQSYGYFQNRWKRIFEHSPLADITPHILRHSFASIANDLGFTEITIASLIGHAKGSITGRYIHTLDTALVMAVDNISGYISGLLDGANFKQNSYALDRATRKAALARFLADATGQEADSEQGGVRLVA